MADTVWTYPAALRTALEDHGIAPVNGTPPRLVRGYLNDLYRFEIRRLRDDHVCGKVARPDYVPRVIALRKKYVALSLTPEQWEALCRGDANRVDAGDGALT